jgi:hypothetical protein
MLGIDFDAGRAVGPARSAGKAMKACDRFW